MRILISQIQWQLLILHRNQLVYISAALTLVYAFIFYLIKDLPNTDRFLVLLIFNDPAMIGILFIGLSVILEKNQSVFYSLIVTPISLHSYLISRIISLSLIGVLCATGMTVAMLGLKIYWIEFLTGVFATCTIFSLAGILIVSYTSDFLVYLLRSIPVLLFLSLPLLNYFEVTAIAAFDFTPLYSPLQLIEKGISSGLNAHLGYLNYFLAVGWMVVLYFLVFRLFSKRIKNST
ncbi:MAG: hypothetical protein HKN76_01345 [Saprospiraceae bacterium]|nr:hypothetical protein [Saprospiraceae bacterium]